MKVLVADDDRACRVVVRAVLSAAGYDVIEACDGQEALAALSVRDAPTLAILDWMMPFTDGLALCRTLRAREGQPSPYVILLTSKSGRSDIVSALDAGADEYLTKPIDARELRARVRVAERILGLQQALANRVAALEESLQHVKHLQGLLPICAWCHKIRDDGNYWQSVEDYFSEHSDARFTHSICPDCRALVLAGRGEPRD